MIGRTP